MGSGGEWRFHGRPQTQLTLIIKSGWQTDGSFFCVPPHFTVWWYGRSAEFEEVHSEDFVKASSVNDWKVTQKTRAHVHSRGPPQVNDNCVARQSSYGRCHCCSARTCLSTHQCELPLNKGVAWRYSQHREGRRPAAADHDGCCSNPRKAS